MDSRLRKKNTTVCSNRKIIAHWFLMPLDRLLQNNSTSWMFYSAHSGCLMKQFFNIVEQLGNKLGPTV